VKRLVKDMQLLAKAFHAPLLSENMWQRYKDLEEFESKYQAWAEQAHEAVLAQFEEIQAERELLDKKESVVRKAFNTNKDHHIEDLSQTLKQRVLALKIEALRKELKPETNHGLDNAESPPDTMSRSRVAHRRSRVSSNLTQRSYPSSTSELTRTPETNKNPPLTQSSRLTATELTFDHPPFVKVTATGEGSTALQDIRLGDAASPVNTPLSSRNSEEQAQPSQDNTSLITDEEMSAFKSALAKPMLFRRVLAPPAKLEDDVDPSFSDRETPPKR